VQIFHQEVNFFDFTKWFFKWGLAKFLQIQNSI
jgi:hypothetical protein